jgi:hypothetical protein
MRDKLWSLGRLAPAGFLFNTAYLAAFALPTIFYMSNVILHIVLGTGLVLALLVEASRKRDVLRAHAVTLGLSLVALGTALYLMWAGNLIANRPWLIAHIVAGCLAALWFLRSVLAWAAGADASLRRLRAGYITGLATLALAPAATTVYERVRPPSPARIENSLVVPTSMQEEGEGPQSPFWPSSARTNVGGIIPSNFFMDSARCGECHKDIFEQWSSSVHHFSSFNNQFYRKAIEHMQEVVGTQPSKWCAGCHDHAVFFNGRFDRPIKEQIDTPEAHAGLACTSCHSISQVHGTVGQGSFTIEYPPLHELATSKNPVLRGLDNFLTYTDPEPHRRVFMKPFMRDSSEFCSTCHKVHLDVPVNNYRWFRGFNDYDNWQASGVSGQGARSFYYPPKPRTCPSCHMPLVASNDPGNRDGKVHSHRFAAANMAVAFVNRDQKQMEAVEQFLQAAQVTLDIFAASPVSEAAGGLEMRRRDEGPELASTFAVGEEAHEGGGGILREVGQVAAPLDKSGLKLRPGDTVRIDVVARTRGVGHFFPGGTVDAFDVWLELQARDATGRIIFWSGRVADDGAGPVEPGAHFYRSYMLDAEGNPINKRNAWQARSALYVRLIPPGSADVAHFRVEIPKDAQGSIHLQARLNYRKFAHYYTEFAYAGTPLPGQAPALLSANHDSREYSFDPANIPRNVSGAIKGEIPRLPIVVVAKAESRIELDPQAATEWRPVVAQADRERWNDWGIGLLQQNDLKGAEYAFKRVTEAEPDYADGWLNVARVLVREGETEAAKPYLAKTLALKPDLPRGHFFKAMVERADGEYDAALASLERVGQAFPRDRVALNQMARIRFLKREYAEAVKLLERVLLIDPEDVQAHYTLMLCYRGLGDREKAAREDVLFRRFKADESAQSITGKRRLTSPEENNERQPIHDHVGVSLADLDGARESRHATR